MGLKFCKNCNSLDDYYYNDEIDDNDMIYNDQMPIYSNNNNLFNNNLYNNSENNPSLWYDYLKKNQSFIGNF